MKKSKGIITKAQQFETLSKRFSLTKEESDEYYKLVRQTRKKSSDLEHKSKSALKIPEYTLRVDKILTREQFENRINKFKYFLSKDYVKSSNQYIRENYYKMLEEYYSEFSEDVSQIIDKLKKMSDLQFKRFIDKIDIDIYIFYEEDFSKYYDMMKLSTEKYKNYLGIKNGKGKTSNSSGF